MTKIYIVTPNYNGMKFLYDYFNSLFSQTFQDFKIIFVENSPNIESIDFIKENFSLKLEKIIFIKNPTNYGFAKANNIGIEKALEDAECEYIVCLNNDIIVERKFLEELIHCAEKHPKAGSIQAKNIWGQNPKLIDSVGLEYSKNGLGFNRGAYGSVDEYKEEEEIFGCCAGACLYKKDALIDIKINNEFFDEDFFAYYEDFDLALRLKWAGWDAWFCPDAIDYHYKGGTTENEKSDFTIYHLSRNNMWTLIKNLPTYYILKKSYLIIISEILQISINILRNKPIIIKSKFEAYKNLRTFLKKKKIMKKNVEFKDVEKWFVLKWRDETPKTYK